MPNTLLEAIFMGAFPIQSNPGGVTAEIITPATNGLLIEDPENIEEIAETIQYAIQNKRLIEKAFVVNQEKVKPNYEYHKIQQKIVALYHQIEKEV
jgi:glycosyltransferase involved in cell wall biosynthesis